MDNNDLRTINIFGAGIEAAFTVHKLVPTKLEKELGEEHRPVSHFLDRGQEKGRCRIFGRNALLIKEILTEAEFNNEAMCENFEMEYYALLENKEQENRGARLKDKLDKVKNS